MYITQNEFTVTLSVSLAYELTTFASLSKLEFLANYGTNLQRQKGISENSRSLFMIIQALNELVLKSASVEYQYTHRHQLQLSCVHHHSHRQHL